MNRQWCIALVLLTVGLAQMLGDLLDVPSIKGLAAATLLSPAPKVFSAVRGLETYSNRFYLEWTDTSGRVYSVRLTAELYQRMRGPYLRRNVYGAALAYGPVLPDEMRDPVMRYALCGDAPLLTELGIDASDRVGPVRVRYEPTSREKPTGIPLVLETPCP